MKSIKILFYTAFLSVCACADEESLENSQLNTTTPALTDLDMWIRKEFTMPYNIEVNYRWNENEVDQNRYLFPPAEDKVRPALELIKGLWIEPYEKLNPDVIKKNAPRVFFLIGGKNVDQLGLTRVLGSAEGGKKVVLYEINLLNVKNPAEFTRFLSTIQHEYAHILNQTVPFDERAYENITGNISRYESAWYNLSSVKAHSEGFITPYASSKVTEDFAEMVNAMLSRTKTEFDALVNNIKTVDKDRRPTNITAVKAIAALKAKETLVAKYYASAFDIDLYKLQSEIAAKRAALAK